MDVKAIFIVGGRMDAAASNGFQPERVAGRPMALLDVLGRPVLHHVIEKLRNIGVSDIAVISDAAAQAPRAERDAIRSDVRWVRTTEQTLWRTAELTFSEFAQNGAEQVFVIRLGAYADVDYEHLLQFHLDQKSRVTQVCDHDGAIETFVISASRRNDAAFLLRHRLRRFRSPCTEYDFEGYCNRLASPSDLRRLAIDGLLQRAGIAPAGVEVRPGIWMGPNARIERGARIVAPVFIGAWARVRASALITRCSAVEHHTEVDCGAIVDNSTLLPYAYVGPGLDFSQCVIGFCEVLHLRRKVAVAISDPAMVDEVSQNVAVRAMRAGAALVSFLPAQLARGLFGRRAPRTLPGAVTAEQLHPGYSNLPHSEPRHLSTDLAVMRGRYGNQ